MIIYVSVFSYFCTKIYVESILANCCEQKLPNNFVALDRRS